MSEMAKEARAKMREKARRMTEAGDPNMKVDASSWMPTEQLNANAKTGLRPVSRRQFRKGGKVLGKEAAKHAGKKPRKTGDDALTANSYLNRNVKEANAELGKPHVGGFKKGGAVNRKHKMDGGDLEGSGTTWTGGGNPQSGQVPPASAAQKAEAAKEAAARAAADAKERAREDEMFRSYRSTGKKHGGSAHHKSHRKHKMDGGPNMSDPRAVAAARMAAANQEASVPAGRMGFQARGAQPMPGSGMKRGGKAVKKMASGGMASSRADGIAQKGKTKGKFC